MNKWVCLLSILLFGCSSFKLTKPEKKSDFFKNTWTKNLDDSYLSGNLPIGLGAPRIYQDIVYMGTLQGKMNAYDVESGRLLWSASDKTPLGGPVEFFNATLFICLNTASTIEFEKVISDFASK